MKALYPGDPDSAYAIVPDSAMVVHIMNGWYAAIEVALSWNAPSSRYHNLGYLVAMVMAPVSTPHSSRAILYMIYSTGTLNGALNAMWGKVGKSCQKLEKVMWKVGKTLRHGKNGDYDSGDR